MKIKEILVPIIYITLLFACEPPEDVDIQELNTLVTFDVISPNSGPTDGTRVGEFIDVYWNENDISLRESTDDLSLSWIEMKNLNITGLGQYQLLINPYAKGAFGRDRSIYSTDVRPDFWLNQSSDVNQGGYVNITSYSSNAISGDFYFIAWRWSSSLNREVGTGVSGRFQDIPYKL